MFTKTITSAAAALSLTLAAGPAMAFTPPEPEPKGPAEFTLPAKIDSGLEFSHLTQERTTSSFTLGWRSGFHKATLEVAKTAPVKQDGKWAFQGPLVDSSEVHGAAVQQGNLNQLADSGVDYDFEATVSDLEPNTKYHVVARLALPGQFEPVEQAWTIKTRIQAVQQLPLKSQPTRTVEMTVKKVHIYKDGDAIGKGEARFGARLAPNAKAQVPSHWAGWTHSVYDYMKVDSNTTAYFPAPITQTVETTKDIAVVEVQGYENDVRRKKACPVEGGPQIGEQFSDKCWDAAVAQLVVNLPDSKEPTTKVVVAQVQGNPDFDFDAIVEVRSWIND